MTAEARQLVPRAKSPSPALSSITTDSNHNEGDEGLKMQVTGRITADRTLQEWGVMEISCQQKTVWLDSDVLFFDKTILQNFIDWNLNIYPLNK